MSQPFGLNRPGFVSRLELDLPRGQRGYATDAPTILIRYLVYPVRATGWARKTVSEGLNFGFNPIWQYNIINNYVAVRLFSKINARNVASRSMGLGG